jgi:hypothetical protein
MHAELCGVVCAKITLSFSFELLSNNPGDVCDKCGGRFHQNISTLEKCYQRRWNLAVLNDCIWKLKRDGPDAR